MFRLKELYNRLTQTENENENENKNENKNDNGDEPYNSNTYGINTIISDIKDKNNEPLLVLFKNKSIINNDKDSINYGADIPMADFIKKINSIASSTHIVDICKSINLTNTSLISCAAYSAINYKSTLNDNKVPHINNYMLKKINCEKNPIINNKLRQSIAITKWKLYNFMIKRQETQKSNRFYVEFDISVTYWLALLCGIYLHFDENDEKNFKHSNLLKQVTEPFTLNSFNL